MIKQFIHKIYVVPISLNAVNQLDFAKQFPLTSKPGLLNITGLTREQNICHWVGALSTWVLFTRNDVIGSCDWPVSRRSFSMVRASAVSSTCDNC